LKLICPLCPWEQVKRSGAFSASRFFVALKIIASERQLHRV
jgi:hypothetical protein